MTIQELYNTQFTDNTYPEYSDFIGYKVRHIIYNNGVDSWSDKVYTIKKFNVNTCGEGCCYGYTLEGIDDCIYRPTQLKIEWSKDESKI